MQQTVTGAALQPSALTHFAGNTGAEQPTLTPSFSSYPGLILYFLLLTVTTAIRAQTNYSSNNSGGGIAYYGNSADENAEGEFQIGTRPIASGYILPKGQYYNLVPATFEIPRTNLEYYPGAEQIAISFKFDTSQVKVNDMRYSITSADSSVLINWRQLPKGRWVPQGGSQTILFLDHLACRNQVVTIKLYHVNNPESVITQIVHTRQLSPPQLFGSVVYMLPATLPKKKSPETAANLLSNFGIKVLNGLTINSDEDLNAASISIHTDVPYFYRAYIIRNAGGAADTVDLPSNWTRADRFVNQMAHIPSEIDWNKLPAPLYSINIPKSLVTKDGRYQVFVTTADYRRTWTPSRKKLPIVASNMLSFQVQHPRAFSSSDVLVIVGALAAIALGYVLLLKQRQRLRLQKEQQAAREARLGMQAVQSQLNPHFIFNALSGIQNLLNKQQNERANDYLSTFSKLTRMVLNDAHKDLIPLKDETELLQYYLQMEQLRFGFNYQVMVAPDVDIQNTEVPPMLLQPFLENAVKHGIASLKDAGKIMVNIRRERFDLFIEVTDNGKGFTPSISYPGKGLELSKSRLSLLNTIHGPIFDLDIRSGVSETRIILTIKNWLT